MGRGIRGPAGYFGKVLPRSITRRLWPRFVRLDQVKSVDEIHRLMQRITAGVDRFIAPSPGMADILVDAGVPAGHVRQLAYGLSPDKMLRPVKAISEALRFGFVGGADPVKGFSTIAAALNLLPAGLPLEIRAFGGDALRLAIDHLPARAKSYVTHTAPRFGRALMEEHARIDAMLVPSVWHENSPFAAIESFANGTPVLGADEPGISHLIVPERNGWIIEAGNAKAWARAFIEAVQQPARIRRMQAIASYARTTADFVDDVERVEASLRPAQPAFMTHRPAVARCMA